METPLLHVVDGASSSQTVPHLLPCQIQYDGPVESIQTYWRPSEAKDGSKVAHFRGRKLHGKVVRVPEGYKGAVLQKVEGKETRSSEPQTAGFVDLEQLPSEAGEEGPRTENLETKAEFEQMVVWGHESTADPSSDPYVRMEEWLTIANQIHSYQEPAEGK